MALSRKKTALVFLCYEDLREVEWIAPTCLSYYHKSVFVAPFEVNSESAQHIKSFFTNLNNSFTTYLGLTYWDTSSRKIVPQLTQKIHSIFYRSLIKCKFGWISRLQVDLFFLLLGRKQTFKNVDAVYFSSVFVRQKESYFTLKFFQFLMDNSIQYASFPINYNHKTETKLKLGVLTFPFTARLFPRGKLKKNRFEMWFDYFNSTSEWKEISRGAGEKPIAVFFTKNLSAANNSFPAAIRNKPREKIINHLSKNGFYVIVKPHPGEKIIKEKTKSDFRFTNLPSTFLCSKASATIFELPTNSIFDAVANGKTPFLPLDLFSDGDLKTTSKIVERYSENMRIAITEFCILKLPQSDSNLDIPKEVTKKFYENYVGIK